MALRPGADDYKNLPSETGTGTMKRNVKSYTNETSTPKSGVTKVAPSKKGLSKAQKEVLKREIEKESRERNSMRKAYENLGEDKKKSAPSDKPKRSRNQNAKKTTAKKATPKKTTPKKAEAKKAEPKKTTPKKATPKKTEAKTEPKKTTTKPKSPTKPRGASAPTKPRGGRNNANKKTTTAKPVGKPTVTSGGPTSQAGKSPERVATQKAAQRRSAAARTRPLTATTPASSTSPTRPAASSVATSTPTSPPTVTQAGRGSGARAARQSQARITGATAKAPNTPTSVRTTGGPSTAYKAGKVVGGAMRGVGRVLGGPIGATAAVGSALISGAQSMKNEGYHATGSGGRNRARGKGGRTAAAMPTTAPKVTSDNQTTTATPTPTSTPASTPTPTPSSNSSGGKKTYAEGYRSQGNAGMGQRGRKRPAPVQEGPTRPAVEARNTKDSWWSQQSAQKSYDHYQKIMDYAEGGAVKKAKPNTLGWGMAASAANAAANRNRVMNDRLGKIMDQMPNRKQNKGKGDK